jgi:hypothetical protein
MKKNKILHPTLGSGIKKQIEDLPINLYKPFTKEEFEKVCKEIFNDVDVERKFNWDNPIYRTPAFWKALDEAAEEYVYKPKIK